MTNKKEIESALLARRATLEALNDGLEDAKASVELDQTKVGRLSRMDAIQSAEMTKATSARRQAEVRAIDAALKRLEEGDYGACSRCGEEIAPARLRHDPAAAFCLNCASGG